MMIRAEQENTRTTQTLTAGGEAPGSVRPSHGTSDKCSSSPMTVNLKVAEHSQRSWFQKHVRTDSDL